MNYSGAGVANHQSGPHFQQGGGFGPYNQQGGGGGFYNQQGGGFGFYNQQGSGFPPYNQQGGGGGFYNQQGGGGGFYNQQGGSNGPYNQQGGGLIMAQDCARCCAAFEETDRLLRSLQGEAITFFRPTLEQVIATQQRLANICLLRSERVPVPLPTITAVLAASAGAQAALMAAFCLQEERLRALEDDRQRREHVIHAGSGASQLDRVACLAVFRGDQHRKGTTIGQLIKLAACSRRQEAGGFRHPQHLANYAAFLKYLVGKGTSIQELHLLTKPLRQGRVEDAHLLNAAESVSSRDLVEWADKRGEEEGQDMRQALELLAPFVLPRATPEQRQLPLRKELTTSAHVSTVVDDAVAGGSAGDGVGDM